MTRPLHTGDRVGDYRVISRLGSSLLLVGEHVTTGKHVVLDVRTAQDYQLISVQMLRAASTLEALSHPGIARIVGHGILPDFRPWIASELPDGVSLTDVASRRRIGPDELAVLLREIAEVLAFAHENNVVHGGLRPQHIVLTSSSTTTARFPISIGDWSALRAPGIPAFGDPPAPGPFVAPEHLHGAIDGRADVYSLGAIAWQLAFDTETPIANFVLAMLEPDPRDRPTMAEVHSSLAALTSDDTDDDRVITSAPRLPRPRWTPTPPELAVHAEAIGARGRRDKVS